MTAIVYGFSPAVCYNGNALLMSTLKQPQGDDAMKFDPNAAHSRFAERALAAFSTTMMELLATKSFESIAVNEICAVANYPRATFYNYFDDKYDLLNYCWSLMRDEIRLDDYKQMESDRRTMELFDRMYDYLDANERQLRSILRLNSFDSELIASFRRYTKEQISDIMEFDANTEQFTVPLRIIAEHYCNTLMLILEWSFLHDGGMPKEQAHAYLNYLLEGI